MRVKNHLTRNSKVPNRNSKALVYIIELFCSKIIWEIRNLLFPNSRINFSGLQLFLVIHCLMSETLAFTEWQKKWCREISKMFIFILQKSFQESGPFTAVTMHKKDFWLLHLYYYVMMGIANVQMFYAIFSDVQNFCYWLINDLFTLKITFDPIVTTYFLL